MTIDQKIESNDAKLLGESLKRSREAKELDLKKVADLLMMSSRQISDMEAGSPQAFYNKKFFLQSIEKYCRFLEVGFPDDLCLERPNEINTVELKENLETPPKSAFSSRKVLMFVCLLFFAVTAIFLSTYITISQVKIEKKDNEIAVSNQQTRDLPATTTLVNSEQSEQTPITKSAAIAETSTSNDAPVPKIASNNMCEICLTFSAPTWIQVSYNDGKTNQRIYQPGETLDLSGDLSKIVSITIGNQSATSFQVRGEPFNLTRFSKNNSVAKIYKKDISSHLTQ